VNKGRTSPTLLLAKICKSRGHIFSSSIVSMEFFILSFLFALFVPSLATADDCNADNCLRALRATKVSASAAAFCTSYMSSAWNSPLPTYAAPCSASASRISSACVCLTATGSSITPTSTSSSKQLSTCDVTAYVTVPVCTSTTTTTQSDSTTSTSTVSETAFPTNIVVNPGFENPYSDWQYTNAGTQVDGPGTPAHSGGYAGYVESIFPFLQTI
jgi:hypothetical protein